jgi:hypothetical protein
MDPQSQQDYVRQLHELVDAAEEWTESIDSGPSHPMYDEDNCPHCRAKARLETAVARLKEIKGGPSDLSPR